MILSDRYADAESAPIPALLRDRRRCTTTSCARRPARRSGSWSRPARRARCTTSLCCSATARGAINPYLAFDTIRDLCREGVLAGLTERKAVKNYVKAAGKGILKVMSKMGISTVASYTGAQIFEAVGLRASLVDEYFTGTASRIEGIDLDVIAERGRARATASRSRTGPRSSRTASSPVGGEYQWRREGEYHLFNPETVFKLQHSTRSGPLRRLQGVHAPRRRPVDAARDVARAVRAQRGARAPVPIDEVEPVATIVKRFSTGAMSYGSISKEAHETLAIAMNRLGGRSNTGEGGEDADRFVPDANGDSRRSAIKQVAVGPLRGDERVPRERRRPPDQDGAGREAGRGRRAAGPQGVPVDREDAALHARASA